MRSKHQVIPQKASEAIGPEHACLGVAQGKEKA